MYNPWSITSALLHLQFVDSFDPCIPEHKQPARIYSWQENFENSNCLTFSPDNYN